jgi:nitrogen regulatory protein PII
MHTTYLIKTIQTLLTTMKNQLTKLGKHNLTAPFLRGFGIRGNILSWWRGGRVSETVVYCTTIIVLICHTV